MYRPARWTSSAVVARPTIRESAYRQSAIGSSRAGAFAGQMVRVIFTARAGAGTRDIASASNREPVCLPQALSCAATNMSAILPADGETG